MKPDPKLEMIGHNVVIDNGTYSVKGGFSDNDAPTCSLPCLVGHGRHKGAMSSLGLKETYVGCAAQKLRGILDISHPIRQGSVQNWDDLEVLWSHILETELKTEGGAQPIIMTQPPLASQQEEDTMAEILVEKLGVPAFFIANKSVMSLYGGGQMTGIAVDSGHDTTYIVPSYQVSTDAHGDYSLHTQLPSDLLTLSFMRVMVMGALVGHMVPKIMLILIFRATLWKRPPWCFALAADMSRNS